jgi:hypothetical protein
MSSRDVAASLLRSAARAAASQLGGFSLARAARSRLRELTLGRTALADDDLTRAVTHVPNVAAATVRCGHARLRIDIGFDDGSQLLMAIAPSKITFAPGGAKELAFAVEPGAHAGDPRVRDVVAAIAGEIARALWRPALAGAPHSEHSAFVSVEGESLVVDLRNVPEVRWALQQTLRAAIIDAIQPRSIDVALGHVDIPLAIRLR